MQITRAADYAVRVMIHLATLPVGSKMRSADLAEATGTPECFLSKVLQRLVQQGLIASYRGNGGGFQLTKPSERVSLLEVIEAIEGTTHLNACLEPGRRVTGSPGAPPIKCGFRLKLLSSTCSGTPRSRNWHRIPLPHGHRCIRWPSILDWAVLLAILSCATSQPPFFPIATYRSYPGERWLTMAGLLKNFNFRRAIAPSFRRFANTPRWTFQL